MPLGVGTSSENVPCSMSVLQRAKLLLYKMVGYIHVAFRLLVYISQRHNHQPGCAFIRDEEKCIFNNNQFFPLILKLRLHF